MTILFYKLFTIIFSPIIDLYLLIRLIRGKEDKKRFSERFGYSKLKRPSGELLWFQCASVGESNSVLPLIYKIIEKYGKKVTVLITTVTTTSANIMTEKLKGKENIIHQYTPIDKYFVIKRFLKHWKPNVLITVESEIWPNMITMSHKVCDKVMIVNAKISEKSFNRWKKFKSLKESIFDSIDICYPQSQEDQYRLINLGIQNTQYFGNLKFDIPKLKVNDTLLKNLKELIGNRKMLLCASTHIEEDKIILDFYKSLQKKFPDLIFIMALRHPAKTNITYDFLISNSMIAKRKSFNETIDFNTNFYLFNEMGEMGTLFELSDIVLVCGSLVNRIGGHTPVEPAKHSCAIFTGPYIKNNKSLFVELEKNNGCIICKDEGMLTKNLTETATMLITNLKKQTELKENAIYICDKFSNVANDVAKSIIANLK